MSSVEEPSLRFLEKVREGFTGAADDNFLEIDGLQGINSIHKVIARKLAEVLSLNTTSPAL